MQTERAVERLGSGRAALVSRLLLDALPSVHPAGGSAAVLDCGGGSGAYAVPLARAGADVTVVDVSADALATLVRRADEAGVSASVHAAPGDVDDLGAVVDGRSFDLVLAHGILDAVDHLEPAFAAMAAVVRPGGLFSVLVANPAAAVLARALAGDPALALIELRELAAAEGRRGADPAAVLGLANLSGLVLEARHGIGMFADLVPGSSLDTPAARAALAELDLEAAGRAPFADLAGRIHLLLRRPVAASGPA